MAIKMVTPEAEIKAHFDLITTRINSGVVEILSDIGDRCTSEARDRSGDESWYDNTGRLRSSIGNAVAVSGKIVIVSPFEVIGEGSQGTTEGRQLVTSLAAALNNDFTLCVGAGAPYSEEVEAMENKVVLTSAELLAKRDAPGMMRQLVKQI